MAIETHDKSQLVQVLIWFLFVVSVLGVCARVGTQLVMKRLRLGWDNGLLLTAQAVFLGQCISVSIGASKGLGKAMDTLTEEDINDALKAEYASLPLLLLTLTLVKWSLSAFIHGLSPDTLHRFINACNVVVVSLWGATAIITSLFQCDLPSPWDYADSQRCFNQRSWWTYVGALNVATEISNIVLYFMIFWRLQASRLKRFILLSIFSLRIFVVAAVIVQLVVFRDSFTNANITYRAWLPTITNQIVGSLSIVTACIPYLKPFMESLEADLVRVESDGEIEEEVLAQSAVSPSTASYTLNHYSNLF